jgi:hypothetical protein
MNRLNPFITVSIVSHGDYQKILHLLESMRTYEQASSIQVVITDNLGNEIQEIDDTPWTSLIVVRNKRTCGFAQNHNRAFQFAKGKYFCVLNPDVFFEQKVFSSLTSLLETGQADIVTPLIVDVNAVPQDSFRDFPTPFEIIRRRLPGYRFVPTSVKINRLIQPDWIAGMFMLMRSETYQKFNGFNEKYRLYFEDVDFCARAQIAGLKIVVDTNIRVQHNAHRASRRNPIYLLWHLQSAIRFFTSPTYKKAIKKSK